jgi:primosomal protein N' (replication factor Y)
MKSWTGRFSTVYRLNYRTEVSQGSAVIVPFGAGNREIKGFVIGISDTPGIDCAKIKSIIRTDDDTVSPENSLVMIAAWIKKNYGGTMIQALKTVLPVKEKQKILTRRVVTLNITDNEAIAKSAAFASKHQLGKARALEALSDENMLPYELLTQKKNIAPSTLQSLVKAGIITSHGAGLLQKSCKGYGARGDPQYTQPGAEEYNRYCDERL